MLLYVLVIIAANTSGSGGISIKDIGPFSKDGCEAAAQVIRKTDRIVGYVAAHCVYRQ